VVALVLTMGLHFFHAKKDSSKQAAVNRIKISEPVNKDAVQEGLSEQVTQQDKAMQSLQAQLDAMEKQVDLNNTIIGTQLQSIKDELKKAAQNPKSQAVIKSIAPSNGASMNHLPSDQTFLMHSSPTIAMQVYTPPTSVKKLKLSDHVTAGTSAVALVLSGAATDAGANGQGNTVPIRLKIETNGRLPNGHRSSLKGCFLTASAYGNVSSERGEIRLQRISCIRTDGTVLEKTVEGTVVDQSGMNGISGDAVLRSGPMLNNAFWAKFLEAAGIGLAGTLTTQETTTLGNTVSVQPSDFLKYSTANGLSGAANQLARQFVKLSNLYHPVIEVHPGQFVGIFFLKGFSLSKDETDIESSNATPTPSNQTNGFNTLPYFNAPMKVANKQSQTALSQLSPQINTRVKGERR